MSKKILKAYADGRSQTLSQDPQSFKSLLPSPSSFSEALRFHSQSVTQQGLFLEAVFEVAQLKTWLSPAEPYQAYAPADAKLTIKRMLNDTLEAQGQLHCIFKATCVRCITLFELVVAQSLHAVLTVGPPQENDALLRDPMAFLADDGDFASSEMEAIFLENDWSNNTEHQAQQLTYREDEMLDLSPWVHDELLLALPLHPLCHEACLGLCAECGKNLNQTPCQCLPDQDMRWHQLRSINLKKDVP